MPSPSGEGGTGSRRLSRLPLKRIRIIEKESVLPVSILEKRFAAPTACNLAEKRQNVLDLERMFMKRSLKGCSISLLFCMALTLNAAPKKKQDKLQIATDSAGNIVLTWNGNSELHQASGKNGHFRKIQAARVPTSSLQRKMPQPSVWRHRTEVWFPGTSSAMSISRYLRGFL